MSFSQPSTDIKPKTKIIPMEIKKINKDITLIQLGSLESNIYLIDKKVLIDTGLGFHPKMLKDAFKRLNMNFTDIERIIFTHAHYDHTGGIKFFKNAKIAIHKNDAEILETADPAKSCAFAFGKTPDCKKVDIPLEDLDTIRIGTIKLKAIHTPGHTEGSICLYDENDKILFTGDTIFSNAIGRTDLPGSNEKEIKDSLKKLKHLDIKTILPGHGNIIEKDAREHINRIIKTYTE